MYLKLFFFFQAEDGIRDGHVTGVQTCALPICSIFNKLHSASVVVAFGVIAVSLAAMLTGEAGMITRALLIASILAITAPIGTFSMARAAHYGQDRKSVV